MCQRVLAWCQAPIGRADRLPIASDPLSLSVVCTGDGVPTPGGRHVRPDRRIGEFILSRPLSAPWAAVAARVPGFWSGEPFCLKSLLSSITRWRGVPASIRRRSLREQCERALVAGILIRLPDGRLRLSPVWCDQYPGSVRRDKPVP